MLKKKAKKYVLILIIRPINSNFVCLYAYYLDFCFLIILLNHKQFIALHINFINILPYDIEVFKN